MSEKAMTIPEQAVEAARKRLWSLTGFNVSAYEITQILTAALPLVGVEREVTKVEDIASLLQRAIDYHDNNESKAEACDMPESADWHQGQRNRIQAAVDALSGVERTGLPGREDVARVIYGKFEGITYNSRSLKEISKDIADAILSLPAVPARRMPEGMRELLDDVITFDQKEQRITVEVDRAGNTYESTFVDGPLAKRARAILAALSPPAPASEGWRRCPECDRTFSPPDSQCPVCNCTLVAFPAPPSTVAEPKGNEVKS